MIQQSMMQTWSKQSAALRDLKQVAETVGLAHSLMLIGATARLVQLDWPARLATQRTTKDVDLVLQCESWDQYLRLQKMLTGTGLFETGRQPHQLLHIPTQSIIDLVPYGGLEQPDGTVTWGGTGNTMAVAGMAEARANAELIQTALGDELPVVSLPWLVALKIIAWTDRRKSDKGSGDLKDADFVMRNCYRLEHYENAAWDAYGSITDLAALSDRVETLDYGEHAGAAVIAFELSRSISPATCALLISAIEPLATNPYDFGLQHLLRLPPRVNEEQQRKTISLRFAILKEILKHRL